jgi:hypothetical protein
VLLGVGLGLGSAPTTAQAAPPASPSSGDAATPSPAIAAAARAHFVAGVEHYRARRYRDAIRELQVSRSLVPNPEIAFNVGRAHEQLGELQLAVDYYRSYLRDRPDAKDGAELQARIVELEQRMETAQLAARHAGTSREGTIVLEVSPPNALVRVDGAFLEGQADGRVLTAAPGVRPLDAALPGHAPYHGRVDLEPGGLRAAYLELEPLEPSVDRERSRPLVWIAAGLSGAALLSTGALALAGATQRDAGDASAARGLERAAGVSLASAVGLALAAVVLELATSGSAAGAGSAGGGAAADAR